MAVAIQKEYIGYVDDEIIAAKLYDDEAKRRYGEFASLNFPKGDELLSWVTPMPLLAVRRF